MDLLAIGSNATWGNSAADLNENFSRTNVEIEKLRNASFRNKGYFSTEVLLKAAWPSPLKGDFAWAGSPYPGTVWECKVAGTWINTGVVPDVPQLDLNNWNQGDW